MVRPKGTKKLQQIDHINIKLEKVHKRMIEDFAMSSGMTLSSFVRYACLKLISDNKETRL
jgi:uncharacterized protein (DUF1778 family)